MNIGKVFAKIGKGAAWPFQRLSREVGEEIAEKSALAMRAALAEAPVLDALLDGDPISVTITVQLKVGG